MAIKIADGDLSLGGAVIELTDDTKYAIFVAANVIEVYKDIDGTPALEDSDNAAAVHGGDNIAHIHAALRSDEDIVIVSVCDAEQTRDVSVATFDTGTGTIGAWAEAADYTDDAPLTPRCSISIDSSNIPHILYVDAITYHGTDFAQIMHAWDDGGCATELVCDTPNIYYQIPAITTCSNDDLEAAYANTNSLDLYYNRKNAGWAGEAFYNNVIGGTPSWHRIGLTCTLGDTVYRCATDGSNRVRENGVDTGYISHDPPYRRVATALVGTDRYIFYIDTGDDVHLISNNGGGWVDEGDLQVGTFVYVLCEWAFNNEHQTCINYIFDDDTDIFWDEFCFGVARIPRHPAHYNPYYVV